jgi:ATP-binding cassette subfamily C (CFTR/MRP) protein 1
MVWSGPFQILAVMALLARVIRPAPAAVSLAVTVALIPLSAAASHVLAAVRRRVVALTDARVKLCSEVITGIKAIKLYAWERPYAARIGALRARELREVRTASLVGTCNNMLWVGGPILIAMAAFAAHSLLGYQMTATVAFPALALFNLMRFPVLMIPTQLLNLVNAKVALDRIQAFMEVSRSLPTPAQPAAARREWAAQTVAAWLHVFFFLFFFWRARAAPGEEMRQAAALPAGDPALEVRRGDFSWGAASPVLLRGVELRVARGRLVMVVGAVGSGKSSLLAALLGEMRARRGAQVAVRGSTAYTQQDPWIQNATLRENSERRRMARRPFPPHAACPRCLPPAARARCVPQPAHCKENWAVRPPRALPLGPTPRPPPRPLCSRAQSCWAPRWTRPATPPSWPPARCCQT